MSTVAELLEGSPLEPLTGADGVAERLVAVAHRCADWEVWGGAKAMRYWDALSDRVRASCYAGPTLADWWARLTAQMSLSAPHNRQDRLLLSEALSCGLDSQVLGVLRSRAESIVLRVRVANDAAKTNKTNLAERSE